jgi:hypothetical protein
MRCAFGLPDHLRVRRRTSFNQVIVTTAVFEAAQVGRDRLIVAGSSPSQQDQQIRRRIIPNRWRWSVRSGSVINLS